MLPYILAVIIGVGSLTLYFGAFFFPGSHRKGDIVWSGVGLFYALILWLCAGQFTGATLLGQGAAVALLAWFGWQTSILRRQIAAVGMAAPPTPADSHPLGSSKPPEVIKEPQVPNPEVEESIDQTTALEPETLPTEATQSTLGTEPSIDIPPIAALPVDHPPETEGDKISIPAGEAGSDQEVDQPEAGEPAAPWDETWDETHEDDRPAPTPTAASPKTKPQKSGGLFSIFKDLGDALTSPFRKRPSRPMITLDRSPESPDSERVEGGETPTEGSAAIEESDEIWEDEIEPTETEQADPQNNENLDAIAPEPHHPETEPDTEPETEPETSGDWVEPPVDQSIVDQSMDELGNDAASEDEASDAQLAAPLELTDPPQEDPLDQPDLVPQEATLEVVAQPVSDSDPDAPSSDSETREPGASDVPEPEMVDAIVETAPEPELPDQPSPEPGVDEKKP